jgi:hypothetical protein
MNGPPITTSAPSTNAESGARRRMPLSPPTNFGAQRRFFATRNQRERRRRMRRYSVSAGGLEAVRQAAVGTLGESLASKITLGRCHRAAEGTHPGRRRVHRTRRVTATSSGGDARCGRRRMSPDRTRPDRGPAAQQVRDAAIAQPIGGDADAHQNLPARRYPHETIRRGNGKKSELTYDNEAT